MSSTLSNYLQPITAGGMAYAIQKFYFKKADKQSMYFGAAVAAGIVLAEMVTPNLNQMIGSEAGTVLEKVVDIGASGAAAVALNKYVLKNENYSDTLVNDLATVVVANVAAEMVISMY